MCGGHSSGTSPAQISMEQDQLQAQQEASAAQLAEQQREFDIQQQQSQQALSDQRAQQAAAQAEADHQAALTSTWQAARSSTQDAATKSVDSAFASFTPDYYKGYVRDYVAHYQPQIDQQYGDATRSAMFGLARSGNLQSQTMADQFAALSREKGVAQSDVANQAILGSTALRSNVLASKQNLMSQATSDATLGSPIAPGSMDQIASNLNNTSASLARLSNQAGDTVTTLQATPSYSSLGSLFGSAAGSAAAGIGGYNQYNNLAAFNAALSSSGGASPLSYSSGRVSG